MESKSDLFSRYKFFNHSTWKTSYIFSNYLFLLSQWLTFCTFGDSIFSRENKVQTFFQRPLAK